MNYEDEPYVRVYKRKTATFKRIGWEGRTVLWHLFLEADKSGIIDVGDDEVGSVCVLTDLPEDVVIRGLSKLASHGVTERHGTSLVITRFIEAQEAKRSDVARSRDYRERRRAEVRQNITLRDESITQRDESSRPVTAVTKRHSQQSSADQIRETPLTPLEKPAAPDTPAKPAKRVRERTRVDPNSGWDPDQVAQLAAIGRNPELENRQFIAHHESKGTLAASWRATRTTWVLNAGKGYGAPSARQAPPGLVLHTQTSAGLPPGWTKHPSMAGMFLDETGATRRSLPRAS